MRINYNVTGPERKKLVQAISELTGEPMNYKGAPTFGYEVGRYYIDKTGVLIGEDNSELVADLIGLHSFKAVSEEYDTPLPEAEPVPGDVQIPYEAEFGGRPSPYCDDEEPPTYGTPDIDLHHPGQYANPNAPITELMQSQIDEFSEPDNLEIEMPTEDFTAGTFANLEKIVASKATLIKKAVGAGALPIERTETTIKFPWFKSKGDSGEAEAYTAFVSGLCALAKKHKRVTAKEKPVENEKYNFRVFLIRLGFVGDKYKAARKLLMKNLSGNSAFRDGTPNKEDGEHDE